MQRVQAEIVGVVSAVPHDRPDRSHGGTIYLPLAQQPTWSVAIAMSTSVPPATLIEPARQSVAALDPELPIYEGRTMEDLVRATFALTDLVLALVAAFAVLALLVSAAGLFGLIAYIVRATGREQAVRMACGASPAYLLRAQVGTGLGLAVAGVMIGLVLAWPTSLVVEGLLVGVSPSDPLALVGGAGVVLVTAAVARWLVPDVFLTVSTVLGEPATRATLTMGYWLRTSRTSPVPEYSSSKLWLSNSRRQ